MLTVGELIESAREGDPGFGEALTPNRILYGELARYARALAGKVQIINANALTITETVEMPLDDFTEGIALPDNVSVQSLHGVGGPGPGATQFIRPIRLINRALQHDLDVEASSAWQEGSTLYLTGAASRWADLTSIAIALVPAIEDVTTDEEELPLPIDSHDAMVQRVRLFLTRRGVALKTHTREDVRDQLVLADRAEADYLRIVGNALGYQRFTTRDVTRGRY